ncbi:hypothetical protein EI613_20510 [Azospirillum sp. 412522]|nr:hypothetical protein [Azospirillum sp. 412522]MBY6264284.1 hypothetical protein [Azospirillum sp. 412522]
MTVNDRNSIRHDRPATPVTDPVALRLRRRHWSVLALAVAMLAGVAWAACRLTALTPATATAATGPWEPRLPVPSLTVARSGKLAWLPHLDPPHKKEPAETPVPAGPVRLDPAVRLLVDQGWPGLRPTAIPAAARTAGILATSEKASP